MRRKKEKYTVTFNYTDGEQSPFSMILNDDGLKNFSLYKLMNVSCVSKVEIKGAGKEVSIMLNN